MIAGLIFDAILIATAITLAAYVYIDGLNHGDWQNPDIRRRLDTIRKKRR